MLICVRCGHRNLRDALFCGNPGCGSYLEWNGVATPTATSLPAVAPNQTHDQRLSLENTALSVEAGDTVTTAIELHNTSAIVEGYTLLVDGPAAAWTVIAPQTLSLLPDTAGRAELRFTPPRSHRLPAGEWPFRVTTIQHTSGAVVASATGAVTVAPYIEVSMSVEPATSTGRWSTGHRVTVTNASNTAVDLLLTFRDNAATLHLPRQKTIRCRPGTITVSPVSFRPKRLHLWGTPLTHHAQVSAIVDEQTLATAAVASIQSALVPHSLLRLAATTAVPLAVLVTGAIVFAEENREPQPPPAPPAPGQIAPPPIQSTQPSDTPSPTASPSPSPSPTPSDSPTPSPTVAPVPSPPPIPTTPTTSPPEPVPPPTSAPPTVTPTVGPPEWSAGGRNDQQMSTAGRRGSKSTAPDMTARLADRHDVLECRDPAPVTAGHLPLDAVAVHNTAGVAGTSPTTSP